MKIQKNSIRSSPPAYLSKSELRYQLSLSNGVIERMILKGLLPKALNFDGNQRWQWSEVEACIAKSNNLDIHDTDKEVDDVMEGLDNVSIENISTTSSRRNTR